MAQQISGKYYREGLSLIELFQMFPDDKFAEDWFIQVRWPEGVHCPHCGSTNVQTEAKDKNYPFRCRDKFCRKRFNARTKTAMASSNLGYQKWAVAFYLLTTSLKSVSSTKLHRDLKITQTSAWHLAYRIRTAYENSDGSFSGIVEVDEENVDGLE